MVNHAVASRINIQRMKQVYQQLARYRNDDAEKKSKYFNFYVQIFIKFFINTF